MQAELRINGNKMRFGFANDARGFTQLAGILKECNLTKVWAGANSPDPTAMLLRCGSIARAITSAYSIRGELYSTFAAPEIETKPIYWMLPLLPILFVL